MHATIPELLNARDARPVDVGVAPHLAQCASCARELRQLSRTRRRLQGLSQFDAPTSAWEQIQQEMRLRPAAPNRRFAIAAAVAAIAMFGLIVGVVMRDEDGQPIAMADGESSPAAHEVDATLRVAELVAQSRELDQLLHVLPDRPLIERVSTAATIDTIEQRIQWLDYQLSYAPEEDLSDTQSQRLWRERVELMDSLVKVRYAEARRLSF